MTRQEAKAIAMSMLAPWRFIIVVEDRQGRTVTYGPCQESLAITFSKGLREEGKCCKVIRVKR